MASLFPLCNLSGMAAVRKFLGAKQSGRPLSFIRRKLSVLLRLLAAVISYLAAQETAFSGWDESAGWYRFFREIGNYAIVHHTCIGLEANPPIYQTNYINTTQQALDMISEVGSPGLKLNLDVGTMIANEEDVSLLEGKAELVNHIHISEPFLKSIKKHVLHRELATFLRRQDMTVIFLSKWDEQ